MNKIRRNLLVAMITALSISAASTQGAITLGQSIGIDFDDGGNTAGSGSEPNFLVLTGNAVGAGTVTTTGGSTGGVTVDFNISSGGVMGENDLGSKRNVNSSGGSTGATGVYAGDAAFFSDLSFNDGVYSTGTLTLTFHNLDNGLSYTLRGLGTGGATANPSFNINGDGFINSPAPLNYDQYTGYDGVSTANVQAYKLSNVSTNGAGDIQIVMDWLSGGAFGYAALHLTADSVAPLKMDVIRFDFEDNNLGDTTQTNFFHVVSGSAFDAISDGTASQPIPYNLLDGQTANVDAVNPQGGGDYLVRTDFAVNFPTGDTVTKPGDGATGVIETDAFVLPSGANVIDLVLSADMAGNGGSLQLVRDIDDAVLETILGGLQSVSLTRRTLNIFAYAGETVYLRISDTATGAWGHIAVDNILIQKSVLAAESVPAPAALPAGLALMMAMASRRRRPNA